MDINNKSKIYWACRRGSLELEIIITQFFKHNFDNLNNEDKLNFIKLLKFSDADLFNWLINCNKTFNYKFINIISMIQMKNKSLKYLNK